MGAGVALSERAVEDIQNQELDDISPEMTELYLIQRSYTTPLRAYAMYLEKLERQGKSRADDLRDTFPLGRIWLADHIYRAKTMKNSISQTIGPQGAGKSLATLGMAMEIDPDFNEDKIFFYGNDLVNYVRNSVKKGDVLVMDEQIDRFGSGSRFMDAQIQNLEGTQRVSGFHMKFVYVEEKSHMIHHLCYARTEHHDPVRGPPYVDYFVIGILQPGINFDADYYLGNMVVRPPHQKLIKAYQKKKDEFAGTVRETGGIGGQRNLDEDYGYIIEELKEDKKFETLNKTTRQAYVTHKYSVTRDIADLIMAELKWRGVS